MSTGVGQSDGVAGRGARSSVPSASEASLARADAYPLSVRPASARPRVRALRTAAVLIRYSEDGLSYAEIASLTKNKVDELEIVDIRIRKAQMGNIFVEIPRKSSSPKSDEIRRLRSVFLEYERKISVMRPIRKSKVRLLDVEHSVTADEVADRFVMGLLLVAREDRVGPLCPGWRDLNSM